jgi:putative tricarboxylic transport membrane protein
VISQRPEVLWGVVASMYVGNLILLVLIDPSPLVVALVLGPLMEKTLRQSLFMARGDWLLLAGLPITAALLLLGLVAVAAPLAARWWRGRAPTPVGAAT